MMNQDDKILAKRFQEVNFEDERILSGRKLKV